MAPNTLPLRVALIGLSSQATTSWASKAHLPALLSATGRSKYEIKALLNSSEDAAKKAVKAYNLPPDTKTYGSPDALAADKDIDVVICNTRVDRHYETIIPSVRAGKDVFVEWPIAATREHIDDLIATAEKSGSRIAVGLQRRWLPVVVKMRELLDGGKGPLGKVLSAEVNAYWSMVHREIIPPGLKYFTDSKIGGNPITIGFGHAFDLILSILGDLEPSSVQSKTQIERPQIGIGNPATGSVQETVTSDVPDLLSLNTTLAPSPQTVQNATLSFSYRRSAPFPGTPALIFNINCEHGEIRLVSPTVVSLEPGPNDKEVTIQVHSFATGAVEDVAFGWREELLELPLVARSVAETLFAFAEGREEGDGWVGIRSAAGRAGLIEGMLKSE